VTVDNLKDTLHRIGVEVGERQHLSYARQANYLEGSDNHSNYQAVDSEEPAEGESQLHTSDEVILREVYQVLQRRQRAPPVRGYPFSNNNHVKTKMKKMPPSPCKVCRSDNHWDKECPDWSIFLEQQKRRANLVRSKTLGDSHMESEKEYSSAYSILLNHHLAEDTFHLKDMKSLKSGFDEASFVSLDAQILAIHGGRYKIAKLNPKIATKDDLTEDKVTVNNQLTLQGENTPMDRNTGTDILQKDNQNTRRVVMEEIEDEETQAFRRIPKADKYLLESNDDKDWEQEEIYKATSKQKKRDTALEPPAREEVCSPLVEEVEDEHWAQQRQKPTATTGILEGAHDWEEEIEQSWTRHASSSETLPSQGSEKQDQAQNFPSIPPPGDEKPVQLTKWRKHRAGPSAIGVSVLSVKGWVGSTLNRETDLQLDLCANITLISQDFYESLQHKPPLQQGLCMDLYQLTERDTSLAGFVRIPIIMVTKGGQLVESEAEVYIVPNMTVPILLGKDYQINYEIGVSRNVEEGSSVHFRRTEYSIRAEGGLYTPPGIPIGVRSDCSDS
jgi:hypothetical protein